MRFLLEGYFFRLSEGLFARLQSEEQLALNILAEDISYIRINHSKVRQPTKIVQAFLNIQFYTTKNSVNSKLALSGELERDLPLLYSELENCRKWTKEMPQEAFLVYPEKSGSNSSFEEVDDQYPSCEFFIKEVLPRFSHLDMAGLFFSGTTIRGYSNSLGQVHWFKNHNYYFDYSLYNLKQKAVKSMLAGKEWSADDFEKNLKNSIYKLENLEKESLAVERGAYRVYLEPAAVEAVISTLSWDGLSMSAHQRGNGSLKDLWKGKKKLNPKFSLAEDFSIKLGHQFNNLGKLAKERLPLIEKGEFRNFLVSSNTAKEFSVESNFASRSESPRSPVIANGTLKQEEILQRLDKGLYISNLHYLNWSDRASARITGMTRYACFWVEDGKIVAPIKDLRFDESLYHIFGDGLLEITDFSERIPDIGSYDIQAIGGGSYPGVLIEDFKFTL